MGSGGSKGGTSTSSQTSGGNSTTSPPQWVLDQYSKVLGMANKAADKPFQNYGGEFVAPVNPTQQGGIDTITGAAGSWAPYTAAAGATLGSGLGAAGSAVGQGQYYGTGLGQAAIGQTNQTAQGSQAYNNAAGDLYGAGYTGAQPFNAGAAGLALAGTGAVNPTALTGDAIRQYESPYNADVVNATVAQMQNQFGQQRRDLTGNQILSGSFGSDRGGVGQGVLANQQSLALGQTVSGLYNQNYAQALQAAQQQQGVGLGAAQGNRAALQQGAGQLLGVGNQIYGQGTGTGQAVQGLGNQVYNQGLGVANQYLNTGNTLFGQGNTAAGTYANLGIGGANAFSGLGTANLTNTLSQGQSQIGAGTVAQQTKTAEDQARYNQFLQEQGYDFQTAQFLAGISEGIGALSGSSTTSSGSSNASSYTPQPFFSDERLKEDIHVIGHTNDGQEIIRFRYRGQPHTQLGLRAQDVLKHHPDAVGKDSGYLTVDYDAATRDAMRAPRADGGLVPRNSYDNGSYASGGAPDMASLVALHQSMYPSRLNGIGIGEGPRGMKLRQRSGATLQGPKVDLREAKLPTPASDTSLGAAIGALNKGAETGKNVAALGRGAAEGLVGTAAKGTYGTPGYEPPTGGLVGREGGFGGGWIQKQFEPSQAPPSITSTPLPPVAEAAGGRVGRAPGGGLPYDTKADYVPEDTAPNLAMLLAEQKGMGSPSALPVGAAAAPGGKSGSQSGVDLKDVASLAATVASFLPSDERLKENIHVVGRTHDGQEIIRFNYKGQPHTQLGLRAQDVLKHHPEAVGKDHGYLTVDYDAATRDAVRHTARADGGRADGLRPGFNTGGNPDETVSGEPPIAGPPVLAVPPLPGPMDPVVIVNPLPPVEEHRREAKPAPREEPLLVGRPIPGRETSEPPLITPPPPPLPTVPKPRPTPQGLQPAPGAASAPTTSANGVAPATPPVTVAATPPAAPAPSAAPSSAQPAAWDDMLARSERAIATMETGSPHEDHGWGTVGKTPTYYQDGTVDRPYGRFQVMGRNIPSWTKKYFGRELTPQEFLDSREAQRAVFRGQFGDYVTQFGHPAEAAGAWLGGPGGRNGTSRDGNGKSVPAYRKDFMSLYDGSPDPGARGVGGSGVGGGASAGSAAPAPVGLQPATAPLPDPFAGRDPYSGKPNRTHKEGFFDEGGWLDRNQREVVSGLTFLGNMLGSDRRTLLGSVGQGLAAAAPGYLESGFTERGLNQRQIGLGQTQQQLGISSATQLQTLWADLNSKIAYMPPGSPQRAAAQAQADALRSRIMELSGAVNPYGGSGVARLAQVKPLEPATPGSGGASTAPALAEPRPGPAPAATPASPAPGPTTPPAAPSAQPPASTTPTASSEAPLTWWPADKPRPWVHSEAPPNINDYATDMHPERNPLALRDRAEKSAGNDVNAYRDLNRRADEAEATFNSGYYYDKTMTKRTVRGHGGAQQREANTADNARYQQAEAGNRTVRQAQIQNYQKLAELFSQYHSGAYGGQINDVLKAAQLIAPNIDISGARNPEQADAILKNALDVSFAAVQASGGASDARFAGAQHTQPTLTNSPVANRGVLAQRITAINQQNRMYTDYLAELERHPDLNRSIFQDQWQTAHPMAPEVKKTEKEIAIRGATPTALENNPNGRGQRIVPDTKKLEPLQKYVVDPIPGHPLFADDPTKPRVLRFVKLDDRGDAVWGTR